MKHAVGTGTSEKERYRNILKLVKKQNNDLVISKQKHGPRFQSKP